jgi:homoserine O-succinyltransferase
MDAVRSCAAQSLYICWSAQAALWRHYRIPKHALPEKAFGVFRQQVLEPSPLLDGLGTHFPVPVSRHTEVHESDLPPNLHVLARSARSGLCLIADENRRTTYMFNHLEYDVGTLVREYERDRMAGKATNRPGCDHGLETPGTWLPSARRFFGNWLTSAAAVREERCPLAGPLVG